jgi:carbonic anhydrase
VRGLWKDKRPDVPFSRPASLDDAVARLLEGNRRFVEERPRAPVPSAERVALASGQMPYAVVLGCSDSRVPIETIFDQHPGNLFVVRIAGNIVTDEALGSIEYGIELLQCMLVVVLGHTRCGAVGAALQHVESSTAFPGHIQRLAELIAPAATQTRGNGDDWWEDAVIENVRIGTRQMQERSTIVRDAVMHGMVRAVGAVYDLHSGEVSFVA